jgi:hypothetical protein
MTEATRPGALLVCTSLLGIVGCMAPSSTPVATHDAGIAVADAVLDAIESVPEISPSDLALPETAPPDTTPPDATTPDEATPDEATPDEATPDEATPPRPMRGRRTMPRLPTLAWRPPRLPKRAMAWTMTATA